MSDDLTEIGEFDDYEDDDENDDFDCGMCFSAAGIPMGCQLAGTEDCDWECPYRKEFESEEEVI